MEKTGKREQTLLIFTSDNGGSTAENNDTKYPNDTYPQGKIPGNNHPWRGEKGQVYEGGVRVAAVASWPGKLKPGKIDVPWHIADWMPSLCALAGYQANADLKWDGQNMWPVLSGETSHVAARPLYIVSPAWRSQALCAQGGIRKLGGPRRWRQA